MITISKPGIYRGVSSEDYFADPCPEPSLTQSLAKLLVEYSARHAWTNHPRLNPDFQEDTDSKFDLGNAAHTLMLSRGKNLEILAFEDYRRKGAPDARDRAIANGRSPILQHQFDRAATMQAFALNQLSTHEDFDAFQNGSAEVMICWHENGIWFRSLIDYLHDNLKTIDDYKTSAKSLAPHVIGYVAESAGWHIQAAFIERGLDILDPENAGRRRYRFIAQETAKPHALVVMHMNEAWLTMGRKQVNAAVSIWRRCIETDIWPAYPNRGIVPDFPGYREAQWLDREVSGEFDLSLQMAG